MRFKYDKAKSEKLKKDPRRKIGFEEVKEIWTHYHYVDVRSDDPEQFRVIGWVKGKFLPSYMRPEKIWPASITTL
jgi:hypothetical protein